MLTRAAIVSAITPPTSASVRPSGFSSTAYAAIAPPAVRAKSAESASVCPHVPA